LSEFRDRFMSFRLD